MIPRILRDESDGGPWRVFPDEAYLARGEAVANVRESLPTGYPDSPFKIGWTANWRDPNPSGPETGLLGRAKALQALAILGKFPWGYTATDLEDPDFIRFMESLS